MTEKLVRAERVSGKTLAVIYDGGELGAELATRLRQAGLRVILVNLETSLPVLEKPSYVIFFASEKEPGERLRSDWREAVVTAKRNQAHLLLCLDNLSVGATQRLVSEADDTNWPVTLVEIVGDLTSRADLVPAAEKIIREMFSSRASADKVVLVGKKIKEKEIGKYTSNVTNRLPQERGRTVSQRPKSWWGRAVRTISLLVIGFFLPFLLATALAIWGVLALRSGEKLLVAGQFDQVKKQSEQASEKFTLTGEIIGWWAVVADRVGLGQVAKNYNSLILIGKAGAEGMGHGASAAKWGNRLLTEILDTNSSETSLNEDIVSLKGELSAVEWQLGLVQAQWPEVASTMMHLASWAGLPAEKLTNLTEKISLGREFVVAGNRFLDVLPEVVGKTGETKKKYLVVLQNSSELRPTGGFIGSYAIVSFDSGKLLGFKINDIYSADGQLKGRIQPPDEILHFLGQPSWYMRDANWAVDWQLTAKRLEWFLDKETGEKVDGVWAVSLPAVQKFLVATGPLTLPELSQTVSGTDFYRKAEYTSEINFFPGSTQKRDFLGATAFALLSKMTSPGEKDWAAMANALGQALWVKDILLYFDGETIQKTVEVNSWAGEITTDGCTVVRANCLMIVDANLGANKANFFLNRSVAINAIIGKGGEVENRVILHYQNNSPSVSWPGGTYKNYLRFLVPVDSQLVSFDLGDGRKPKIFSTLTAEALSAVPSDQFLVFQNFELSGKSRGLSDSALLSFGTFFEVPVGQERTISFSFRPGYRVSFLNKEPRWDFLLVRQPGAGNDPLEILVDYPEFLQPPNSSELAEMGGKTLVFAQKLDYTSDLSVDQKLSIKFQQSN